jgi:hypothetical protein
LKVAITRYKEKKEKKKRERRKNKELIILKDEIEVKGSLKKKRKK